MKFVLISYPKNFTGEIDLLIRLFEEGLEYYHLRKPELSKKEISRFIEKLPIKYRSRIIVYKYFDLVQEYGLRGIHFNKDTKHLLGEYKEAKFSKSMSVHSFEELQQLNGSLDYVLLSPIFNSISKSGYKSQFTEEEVAAFFYRYVPKTTIIALGGINEDNAVKAINMGFHGVAILGSLWNSYLKNNHGTEIAVDNFLKIQNILLRQRQKVLTIAGLDPSCGAGLTADIKAFEFNRVYGMGVCSALTIQNEKTFKDIQWQDKQTMVNQLEILFKEHHFEFVKIGLIENLDALEFIVDYLLEKNGNIKIIWDPIFSSTSGFVFHDNFERQKLKTILKKIYLVTPNVEEAKLMLGETEDLTKTFSNLKKKENICSVLLKGGHGEAISSDDTLISIGGVNIIKGDRIYAFEKHGTGCVLSSAITATLAKGSTLLDACISGKKHIKKFIHSNRSLLGYHN